MNCSQFSQALEAFLDETLPEEEGQRCALHLAGCAHCRKLWRQRGGELFHLPDGDAARLSASILAATDQDSCAAATAQLCELLDESLAEPDRHYLEQHLATCADCTELLGALGRVNAELANLARLTPARDLSAAILRQTSGREASGLWQRFRESNPGRFAAGLLQRPRFAMEAAFLFTLFWTSVFGLPGSVSIAVEASSLQLVNRAAVERRLADARNNLQGGMHRLPQLIEQGVQSASDRLSGIEYGVSLDQGSAAWQNLEQWLQELPDYLFPRNGEER